MSTAPHYVLLSHSTLSSPSHATVSTAPTLTHPTIQYQYRDDPPLSFPDTHHAHVLVMDYDPASPDLVRVQSLSPQLAVTSLKVSDAPGAGSKTEDDEQKNNKMYVLETIAHPPAEKGTAFDGVHPVASLTSFKQRNLLLRRALEYPLPSGALPPSASAPSSAHAMSPRPSPSRRPVALPPHESST